MLHVVCSLSVHEGNKFISHTCLMIAFHVTRVTQNKIHHLALLHSIPLHPKPNPTTNESTKIDIDIDIEIEIEINIKTTRRTPRAWESS
mmetsp:Transcript_3324/g.9212  ORF Transcript_3324/g.9212 Transcript_3324/m.9212 type:complete len:89 (-) Transcript_3324:516-782(-)